MRLLFMERWGREAKIRIDGKKKKQKDETNRRVSGSREYGIWLTEGKKGGETEQTRQKDGQTHKHPLCVCINVCVCVCAGG